MSPLELDAGVTYKHNELSFSAQFKAKTRYNNDSVSKYSMTVTEE